MSGGAFRHLSSICTGTTGRLDVGRIRQSADRDCLGRSVVRLATFFLSEREDYTRNGDERPDVALSNTPLTNVSQAQWVNGAEQPTRLRILQGESPCAVNYL